MSARKLERNRLIAADYRAGMSAAECAAKHGPSRSRVLRILDREGVVRRPQGGPQVTEAECRAYIMRRVRELGRPPRLHEIRADPAGPSEATLERRLVRGREYLTDAIGRVVVEELSGAAQGAPANNDYSKETSR